MRPWLQAIRLRTLPLAVSSIIVGSALAHFHDAFRWPVFILALSTAVLLQILSNLANDLGDHEHGTDNKDRIGPQRAVQSGEISPGAMKRAMIICGVLAFISGLSLITSALGFSVTTLMFLVIGLAAIGAAVKYTYGNNPYGYAGLGDVSVFVFFGLAGVVGTFFLHTGTLARSTLLPAMAFGLLSVGVLNTNNMRDIANDERCGKRTIAVRLGSRKARIYQHFLLLMAMVCLLIYFIIWMRNWKLGIFILGFIVFFRHLDAVKRYTDPRVLDPELKRLALGIFFTALAFSLGLVFS